MSEKSCPVSGLAGNGKCPGSTASMTGPRGCAFIAHQMSAQTHYNPNGTLADHQSVDTLISQERKTITEMLLPEAPARSVTNGLANADGLNPTDFDVLASALGAPARQVLRRAEELGPRTGWRDGYLTSSHGFCPPDASAAPIALTMCPGRVWSDLCERMPAVVARGKMRASILALPLVLGTPDVVPDGALWAAMVCLGILASTYRYEERNDGHEGISVTAPPGTFRNLSGEADDEEEETKGIPRNIAIPLRQISTRMGRVLPHLTQYDVSVYNFKLRDPTSVLPYAARCDNMDLRWPVFKDRGEAMFLLAMAETHGCFVRGVELVTRCQERVMLRDHEGLLRELIDLKGIVDQFAHVFSKISVNPHAGEFFGNPVEWGQRYAKWSAPLSKRVPALSGLALPVFLLMDAFIGRRKYDTFLGKEALHLRAWLPMNIRAFIAAIEYHYQVSTFVKDSGDPRLLGVWEGLIEAYLGERGWFGTHRYKVYGFLEVVAKTGRSETNGNAGSSDDAGRPWEEVHKTLSESMRERMEPYRGRVTLQPHELRGTFEECRHKARILSRSSIDTDPNRSTAMVTFGIEDTGITYQPGDRLAVMPLNSWDEIHKISSVLGLDNSHDQLVPITGASTWRRFARHLSLVHRRSDSSITVRDVLRRGHIAPLTKAPVMAIHTLLKASSPAIAKVLGSDTWPVQGTLGDLLQLAAADVPRAIWKQAFNLKELSWLSKFIAVETPRTYSISNHYDGLLPSTIDLTVARTEYRVAEMLDTGLTSAARCGVSSGCLNPVPAASDGMTDDEEYLIGIARPLNFQLPTTMSGPIAMFGGGSGVAPFRGFWQARAQSSAGRNILFLGVQSRQRLTYEHEMREYVRAGQLELHTAFSRDSNGLVFDSASRDLVEKHIKPRYLDEVIMEQGQTVCDMVISKSQGGLGGHIFVCGSIAMYETIMSGIRRAIYKHWTSTKNSADELLAKAFAERRFMLDIFMTPKPISYSTPKIPLSRLATNTGHRKGSQMWIGVHGCVYDVTDFLPQHPGGTMIVQASAGLDASKTFDDLAHTSNPEVASLLSKYFIGHLATEPDFRSTEISNLYHLWYQYLRICVESLTTLFFEVDLIMDPKSWFQGDLLNIARVRKFYQFQSRLLQGSFSTLFGAKLQELHLQLSYALVSSATSNRRVPDVIGIITRSQASSASVAAVNEIAQLGQFICNGHGAQLQENGILKYAQDVTELDVQFLEEVRHDICQGMDAFDVLKSPEMASMSDKQRLVNLSSYLLSILERVAHRLETFFTRVAKESIYQPELEKNPAKTRWNVLKRKIHDGSFFSLAREISLDSSEASFRSAKKTEQDVMFFEVISQAKQRIHTQHSQTRGNESGNRLQPKRLAEGHTARAITDTKAPSSHEKHVARKALKSMTVFMDKNDQSIKRLSRLPSNLNFEHIVQAYGGNNDSHKARPPVPAKDPRDALQVSHQRQMSQTSVRSGFGSGSHEDDDSAVRSAHRLVRRPTNRSVSSSVGLPSNPSPSAHFSVYPSAVSTSMALPEEGAGMPLPLRLTNRSRSTSRTRTGIEQSMSRDHVRGIQDSVTAPTLVSPPSLVRRQPSVASMQHRLLKNPSRSLSPDSVSSCSDDPRFEMLRPTMPTSHTLNAQLLAEMQRENDIILRAKKGSPGESSGGYGMVTRPLKPGMMVDSGQRLVQT